MEPSIASAVCRVMSEHLGMAVSIHNCQRVSGGSISNAWLVDLDPDGHAFVKVNDSSFIEAFELERRGLDDLRAVGAIRVPTVLAVELAGDNAVLMIEAIDSGPRRSEFYSEFGQQLARLHQTSQQAAGDRFGYDSDNFLGSALQPNAWRDDWPEFFAEHRIGYQLEWARRQSLGSTELNRLGAKLVERLPTLLGDSTESPVLLHGDLWSGNYLCNADGQPVILDPACYYGHREAELGMLMWMGRCPAEFYDAYHECWPLALDWRKRVEIYKLYHQLNHLNLFGTGYELDCVTTLRRIHAFA